MSCFRRENGCVSRITCWIAVSVLPLPHSSSFFPRLLHNCAATLGFLLVCFVACVLKMRAEVGPAHTVRLALLFSPKMLDCFLFGCNLHDLFSAADIARFLMTVG